MVDIKEVLQINSKIEDVALYQKNNFGGKCVYYDFLNIQEKSMGSALVEVSTGKVVELTFEPVHQESQYIYRWINPDFKKMHISDPNLEYMDLEVWEDACEKFKACTECTDFDPSISVPVNLTDEEFLVLSKIAHEKNITFNQLVNDVLMQEMGKIKNKMTKSSF